MAKKLKLLALTLLLTLCLPHHTLASTIAVIQGSAALAQGERRFAAALARHVERWYRDAGVPTLYADDTDLAKSLSGKQVAVLVYVAAPTPPQLTALANFLKRGGKLIVFYSSSPELANLMGMQTAGYLKGSTDGRWSMMRFGEQRPRGAPDSILQTSKNLFVVNPVVGRSQVLAWWHDRQGHQTTEPAWLVSPNGYWMTHIFTADGDEDAKGALLLSLAAAHDPTLWTPAAANVLRQTQTIAGGQQALAQRIAKMPNTPTRSRAVAALQKLRQCSTQAHTLLQSNRGYEAWQSANDLKARTYEVYGLIQPTRRGEIRAVWDHSGMGLYPGDWPRTCRLLKDAGISDIYVNVAGAGFAHYASQILPRSRIYDEQGDQLAACLKAAKPLGLRVHAWLLCFSTEGATQERIAIFHKRGWLLTNPDGSPRPWLDPAVPEARAYLTTAVREMAQKYAVAGVHLDFVRYPDYNSSLGPSVKTHFEKAIKRQINAWPEDVKSGSLRAPFIQWRALQISDFLQATRRVTQRDAPGKLLTTAVYGKYPSCLDAVGQDWESWINIGLVDYVVPMNYTENLTRFNEWLTDQTRTRAQAMKIVPGIGVTAAESRLDAAQVIDQIQSLRRANCPGFALFDLDTTLRQEILPILRMGTTAP